MKKVCYIIAFWFGERRRGDERENNDKLFYLKKQIEYLKKVRHGINNVIFNFNIEDNQYDILNEAIKIIPSKIKNTDIEINIRKNIGMSYGAFSDCFIKNKDKYEYFIFNEDDYIFIENFFDKTLIEMFNEKENCGYFCMIASDAFKRHAGHCAGITTNEILSKIYNLKGELPHSKGKGYSDNELLGQVEQSHSVVELGYTIDDVQEKYRVDFAVGDKFRTYYENNKKEIIVPIQKL